MYPYLKLWKHQQMQKKTWNQKNTSTYKNNKPSSIEKPEIPGLLFKTDLERRPSKKKRRSKPLTITDLENASYSISEEKDDKNTEKCKVECSNQIKETKIDYATINND